MHVQLILSHRGQLFHMDMENSVKEVTENNLLQYVLLYVHVIIFLFCFLESYVKINVEEIKESRPLKSISSYRMV